MRATPENLTLAEDWAGRISVIADDMYRELVERIPVVQADGDLAALTRASCSSNVEAIISMLRSGIPAQSAEAPVTALEHARAMASRGAEVNDTLRFYRLGHGYFLQRWSAELRERVGDLDRVVLSMQEATAYTVEYLDLVSEQVSVEHLAERERRQRRAAVLRADRVAALLQEDPNDLHAAELLLGHRLDGPQLAFVCWSTNPAAQLEVAAVAVAEALGSSGPLLVPDGPHAVAGWVVPSERPDPALTLDRALGGAPDVHVALGQAGIGLTGFRRSRDEACRARRVAGLLDNDRRVVAFADVALLDLLTADTAAARAFVRRELGALADADPALVSLRETLQLVLAPRGGIAHAARRQQVHRNTVLQRLRRAEGLLGRSIEEHATQLHAALLLAAALPHDKLGR